MKIINLLSAFHVGIAQMRMHKGFFFILVSHRSVFDILKPL